MTEITVSTAILVGINIVFESMLEQGMVKKAILDDPKAMDEVQIALEQVFMYVISSLGFAQDNWEDQNMDSLLITEDQAAQVLVGVVRLLGVAE